MESATGIQSLFLSSELDGLGFSKEAISEKVELYNLRSRAIARATNRIINGTHIEKIIVGSRRDGTAFHTSDTDVLLVNHNILCLFDEIESPDDLKERLVLRASSTNVSSGYVFLQMDDARDSTVHNNAVSNCFVPSANNKHVELLSGDKYVEMMKTNDMARLKGWQKQATCYTGRSGPAIRKVFETFDIEADLVAAIPIRCTDQVIAWQKRERHHYWPPRYILNEAINHKCYVVPIGQKGEEFEEFQWRLCFTETEMALTQSMTDNQLKVFILLRLLAKRVLTPISEDVSSYVIKNTMFWLLEGTPEDMFQPNSLLDRLLDALAILYKSIENRELHMYMLTGRNILKGKLKDSETQVKLLQAIKAVSDQGPIILNIFIGNRFKPGVLQSKIPDVYDVYLYVLKTRKEYEVILECMKVLDEQSLMHLHMAVNKSVFSWILYWYELVYVTLPYFRRFGIEKFISTFCASRNVEDKVFTHIYFEDRNSEQGETIASSQRSDNEQRAYWRPRVDRGSTWLENSETHARTDECVSKPHNRSAKLEYRAEDTTDTRTFHKFVDYVHSFSLFIFGLGFSFLNLVYRNLAQALHLAVLLVTWYYLRDIQFGVSVPVVDIAGCVFSAVYVFAFRKQILGTVLNIMYLVCILCTALFISNKNTDNLGLFSELYVNNDDIQEFQNDYMYDVGYHSHKTYYA